MKFSGHNLLGKNFEISHRFECTMSRAFHGYHFGCQLRSIWMYDIETEESIQVHSVLLTAAKVYSVSNTQKRLEICLSYAQTCRWMHSLNANMSLRIFNIFSCIRMCLKLPYFQWNSSKAPPICSHKLRCRNQAQIERVIEKLIQTHTRHKCSIVVMHALHIKENVSNADIHSIQIFVAFCALIMLVNKNISKYQDESHWMEWFWIRWMEVFRERPTAGRICPNWAQRNRMNNKKSISAKRDEHIKHENEQSPYSILHFWWSCRYACFIDIIVCAMHSIILLALTRDYLAHAFIRLI